MTVTLFCTRWREEYNRKVIQYTSLVLFWIKAVLAVPNSNRRRRSACMYNIPRADFRTKIANLPSHHKKVEEFAHDQHLSQNKRNTHVSIINYNRFLRKYRYHSKLERLFLIVITVIRLSQTTMVFQGKASYLSRQNIFSSFSLLFSAPAFFLIVTVVIYHAHKYKTAHDRATQNVRELSQK